VNIILGGKQCYLLLLFVVLGATCWLFVRKHGHNCRYKTLNVGAVFFPVIKKLHRHTHFGDEFNSFYIA
jgi:hypothetical protein